ncbi:MBL fold metallo-hydrolase [Alicyclobacillus fastidiosus]|uniref:MBL fold metallo-hydrolase n=1 Tax=Alicyclobacillus fastidiosus TaxID=392011 RepID=UPI0023E9CADB|nr:MBL fold metallo-hydrolase [Alicyclobacillus fastidiosus]GMA64389.1 MBL fold hydrolase [Alicyclobacillus fastidiosus]
MQCTTWKFYAGTNTIGGNIISMEYGSHRLIFDMGRAFRGDVPSFDERLQPRSAMDLMAVGLAPDIAGIFQGDDRVSSMHTAIAISHCHLDHTGLLPYVRTDLPVFTSTGTHRILQVLDAVADGPRSPLSYRPVEPETWVHFGPFHLQFVPVDHGTPGASAIFIKTPDARLVYTGDLRLHGLHRDETERFITFAREFHPDVLFIEGTRSGDLGDPSENVSEHDVTRGVLEQTVRANAGVYFNVYERHPERLHAFRCAAKAANRELVLDAVTAYMYHHFEGVSDFAVWAEEDARLPEALSRWLRDTGVKQIRPSDVCGLEHVYAAQLPYSRLHYLIDIQPADGGRYLHSDGTPLGPYDPAWANMLRWLDHFGLEFVAMGSSGHATRRDLVNILEAIEPKVCMPIHSLQPWRIGSPASHG